MLKNKKLFLLDIDGTVCKGKQLIGGTKEFLTDIKAAGGQFVFITNNATKSINDYIKTFQDMGIISDYTNFVIASYATVQYLKKEYPGKLIYVLGDRLYTDILSGVRTKVETALVLSGEATLQDVQESEIKPDYIFESIETLHKKWKAKLL